MVFGTMHNLKIVIAAGNGGEQDIDNIVSTEKLLKITPDQDVHLLLTPNSSVAVADADDYLLKANVEREFLVGRGLDRIALWNAGGSLANVYVAIMS